MRWLELFLAYGRAVDVVLSTADVWVPLALGAASLGWGVSRTCRGRRHRRGCRADTSGPCPDIPPDIPELQPA